MKDKDIEIPSLYSNLSKENKTKQLQNQIKKKDNTFNKYRPNLFDNWGVKIVIVPEKELSVYNNSCNESFRTMLYFK